MADTQATEPVGLVDPPVDTNARDLLRQEPDEAKQRPVPKPPSDYTASQRLDLLEHVVERHLGISLTAARAEREAENPEKPKSKSKSK
jgi:hypothetical protein